MRALLAILMVTTSLLGPSCAVIPSYERGPAKRLEVKKESTPGAIVVEASRSGVDALEVFVGRQQSVVMERQIVYATVARRFEYGGPLWEIVEVPFGALSMLVTPFLLLTPEYRPPPDTDTVRYDRAASMLWLVFGPVNPAVSFFAVQRVNDPTHPEELFRSAPEVLRFGMKRPMEGHEVRYWVHLPDGSTVREGTGVTDFLGRFEIDALPNEWLKVKLSVGPKESEESHVSTLAPYHVDDPETDAPTDLQDEADAILKEMEESDPSAETPDPSTLVVP